MPAVPVWQLLLGKGRKKSLPFPKREKLYRAEVTHPGTQEQARAEKAALGGKITASVFSTKANLFIKISSLPQLSLQPAFLVHHATSSSATKSGCYKGSELHINPHIILGSTQKQPNPAGYPASHHTHDPTSSTSTSSWRVALARQCPTATSTFPRRRSSARRWGSARTGASGSAASASRSTSLRR